MCEVLGTNLSLRAGWSLLLCVSQGIHLTQQCQDLSTCISGIWRLSGAPAGKGPAVSGFGRPEGHLRGSGEGLWGDDAAGLGGHTQFCAGVVSPQGAGGGKASWRQRPGYQTEGVPPGSCFSWDSLPVGGVGAEHWAREEWGGQLGVCLTPGGVAGP